MRPTTRMLSVMRTRTALAVGKVVAYDPTTKMATIATTSTEAWRWTEAAPPAVGTFVRADVVLQGVATLPPVPSLPETHYVRVALVQRDASTGAAVALVTPSGERYRASSDAFAAVAEVTYGDGTWVFLEVRTLNRNGREAEAEVVGVMKEPLPILPIYTRDELSERHILCELGYLGKAPRREPIPPGCTAAVFGTGEGRLRSACEFSQDGGRVGYVVPHTVHEIVSVADGGSSGIELTTKAPGSATPAKVRGPRRLAPYHVGDKVVVTTFRTFDGDVSLCAAPMDKIVTKAPHKAKAPALTGTKTRTARGVVKSATTIEMADGKVVQIAPRRVAIAVGREVEFDPRDNDGVLTASNLRELPHSSTDVSSKSSSPSKKPGAFSRPPSSTAKSPKIQHHAASQPNPGHTLERAVEAVVTSFDGNKGEVFCEWINESLLLLNVDESIKADVRLGTKLRVDIVVDLKSDRLLAMNATMQKVVLKAATLTIASCHDTFATAECTSLPSQVIHVPLTIIPVPERRVEGKITATIVAGPNGQLTCVSH